MVIDLIIRINCTERNSVIVQGLDIGEQEGKYIANCS